MVEEMVAANCWPLGRNRPAMIIEMVNLPIFCEGAGVPFPRFGFEKKDGRATEKLVKSTEAGAHEILGEMYLARQAITSEMPWLNRVLRNSRSTTRT